MIDPSKRVKNKKGKNLQKNIENNLLPLDQLDDQRNNKKKNKWKKRLIYKLQIL